MGQAGGTLLWIHGAQPETWGDAATLEQGLARRAGRVRVLAFPAVAGANVLLENLSTCCGLTAALRLGETREDLARTLTRLRTGGLAAPRRAEPVGDLLPAGLECSSHLARLWTMEEVNRLLAGNTAQREAAVRLAVKEQLVTTVNVWKLRRSSIAD